MTTKQYLNQIKDIKKRVTEKASEIAALRELMTSISVKTDDVHVQSSGNPDKIGAMISDIMEYEAELAILVKNFLKKQKEISEQVDSLEDTRCREILHWRYVEGCIFEDIAANKLNVTFRHAIRLHGEALKVFEEKYGNLYKN